MSAGGSGNQLGCEFQWKNYAVGNGIFPPKQFKKNTFWRYFRKIGKKSAFLEGSLRRIVRIL
jgi:hypothetical protein